MIRLASAVALVLVLPAPSTEAAPVAPAGQSCFFLTNGSRQWCVGPPTNECFGWCWSTPCATVERGTGRRRQWHFASEGNTDLGYARPIRQGYWKAYTAGGVSYLGSVERGSARRWDIHDRRGAVLGSAVG